MKLHVYPVNAVMVVWLACCSPGVAQSQEQVSSLIADGAKLQQIADDFTFTEGPAVDGEGNVYFTDQPNDRILKWSAVDGSTGKIETWLEPCGRSNGLFFLPGGDLLACADGNNELWRIAPDKSHQVLASGFDGKLFNGPNDVWCDADGTIYFTDPLYARPYWQHRSNEQQLPKRAYRLDKAGRLSVAAEDFEQPNGIVGDAERKLLFVADIGARKTYRFAISEDGELTDRKLFCEEGSDGMTLDRDGNLYLTGKGVTVFGPDGRRLGNVAVPEGWTANVCFGGPGRNLLFITASDSVYSLEMKVQGL